MPQIWGKIWMSRYIKVKGPQSGSTQPRLHWNIVIKLSKSKTKRASFQRKQDQQEKRSSLHARQTISQCPALNISRFLSRNLAGQGRAGWYIQIGKRVICQPQILCPAKLRDFPIAQMVKNLPAMQETQVQSLGQEDPLEKEMATHSSILAWRIPWTEEPVGLQSMGSQRVGYDWVTNTHTQQWKRWRRENYILRQTEAEGIHHNWIFTRNAKGSSSSWKERMLSSNIKSYKSIKLTCQGKYIVKLRVH